MTCIAKSNTALKRNSLIYGIPLVIQLKTDIYNVMAKRSGWFVSFTRQWEREESKNKRHTKLPLALELRYSIICTVSRTQ